MAHIYKAKNNNKHPNILHSVRSSMDSIHVTENRRVKRKRFLILF
jgi:hypothetical protein